MQKFAGILILLLSFSVSAAPQSEQPSCKIPYELSGWKTSSTNAYFVDTKNLPIGEPIPVGGVLFYVSMRDAIKTYTAKEDVLLNDKSPLTPNTKILAGDTLPVVMVLTKLDSGLSLNIVSTKGNVFKQKRFPVKPDGFLCSDQVDVSIDGGIKNIGMPVVFQSTPLVEALEEPSIKRTRAVAISLQKIEGVVATLQATWIVDGSPARTVTRSFDIMSGKMDLSGIVLNGKKAGEGLILNSISEPDNYYNWAVSFFR